MKRIYYDTKRVTAFGHSLVIHIDKWWGFKKGDVVDVVVMDIDNPAKKVYATKRLSETGNSVSMFIERPWGYNKGDVVVLKLVEHDHNDSRSEIEERDQGLS